MIYAMYIDSCLGDIATVVVLNSHGEEIFTSRNCIMLCYLQSETQCSMTHHANVCRFIEVDKAIRSMCKKLVLQRFDFAFNDKQNGSVRDNPLLQQVSHLPDTNPYMRRELEREKQQLASRRGARSRATNVQQDRSSLTGSRRRQFSSVASATSERLIGKGM